MGVAAWPSASHLLILDSLFSRSARVYASIFYIVSNVDVFKYNAILSITTNIFFNIGILFLNYSMVCTATTSKSVPAMASFPVLLS